MVQFLMNEWNVAAYEDSNYSLVLIEKARSSMKPEHAPFIMYTKSCDTIFCTVNATYLFGRVGTRGNTCQQIHIIYQLELK